MSHSSVRNYTDEPVTEEVIRTILTAGFSASTSSNIQAATVLRVQNPETRAKIAALAGNQANVRTSAVFLVWCADLFRSSVVCEMGGGSFEAGLTEHLVIATVDVALAAQNTAVAAESLGLGICYIGGIRNDPAQVSRLLELPEQVFPVFGMCIGWPEERPGEKPRLPLKITLKEERYDISADKNNLLEYDETVKTYYSRRGAPGRSWLEDMSKLLSKESRPHMRGFLNDRGMGTR